MIQDQDFLIRQIKSMVKGLGKFMNKEQIMDILEFDEEEQYLLSDEEFEGIVWMTKIETIIYHSKLSFADLSKKLEISTERLRDLMGNEDFPSAEELQQMITFVKENEKYL